VITNPAQVTELLRAFLDVLNEGYGLLEPSTFWLLMQFGKWYLVMALIAVLMRATNPAEVLLGFGLSLLKFLFYQVLTVNWRALCDGFAGAMMALGAMVGGGGLTPDDILNAGRIMGLGWRTTQPILAHWQRISGLWDALGAPTDFLLFAVGVLASLVAFFILAVQIVLAVIEFKVISVLAEPLLAFGLFQPTQFIAEAVVKGTVAGAVRLGATALVIGIIIPIINTLGLPPARVPTYWIALNTAAGSLLLMLAAWKVPAYASSLLGGAAAQAAGDLFAMVGAIGYGTVRGVRAVTSRA
jgi:type IV secretion system protein TrbL